MTSYICNVHAGQGFCLAIEDAVVLAWHLRRQGFSPLALRRSGTAAFNEHSSKALSECSLSIGIKLKTEQQSTPRQLS